MVLSVASGRFAHDFFKCAAHSITVGETTFVSKQFFEENGAKYPVWKELEQEAGKYLK